MYKAHVTLTGKQWKSFVKGLECMDDDKKYRMTFYARNLIDWVRFHWSIRRRCRAIYYTVE